MIQYAVWSWYDKLLNSYGQPTAQPVPSPMAAIKTFLAHGANLHSAGSSMHTVLDGLVLNIFQSIGEDRPPEVLASAMSIWLGLIQHLGFNLQDYLRTEAAKQIGKAYDLGMGIRMIVCFDEVAAPHIWTIFQGPQEREKNAFVDRISKCALWEVWKGRYAVPQWMPNPKPYKFWEPVMIWIKCECGCPSLEAHSKRFQESDDEHEYTLYCRRDPTDPSTTISPIASTKRRTISTILSLFSSVRHYRHEFTFYIFVLTCFLGCSYLARLWIVCGFFLAFKVLQDTMSYLG
jgi:hypothetical protein